MYQEPSTPAKPLVTPLRIILFLFLLIVLWGGYFLYSVMYAPIKITTDYGAKGHESVRARQGMPAQGPDNWEPFARLGEKLDAARATVQARHPNLPVEAYDFTLLYSPEADPHSSEFTREDSVRVTLEWLEEFRKNGGIEELRQFPGILYAARPAQDGPAIRFMFGELGKSRAIARMNAARMYLAAQSGDDAQRLAAFEESLAIGRIMSAQVSIIDHLVGLAIHALMQAEVRHQIVEGKVSGPAAADLLAALDRQRLHDLAPVLGTERFFVLDTIQRTFSDTGNGNGRFMPTAAAQVGEIGLVGNSARLGEYRVFNLLGLLQPDRKSTEAKVHSMFDRFAQLAAMPRAERKASGITIDYEAELKGFRVLDMLMPAIGKSLQSRDQIGGDREATRLMLALEVYRGRHGAYPETLAALAPEILPAIPLDAVNGMSFGYKLLDAAADEHGRGYLLYSFASDGIDNGGDMGARPPVTAFLTGGATGQDFVFNQPRPKPEPPKALTVEPEEDHSQLGTEVAPAPVKSGN